MLPDGSSSCSVGCLKCALPTDPARVLSTIRRCKHASDSIDALTLDMTTWRE